MKTFRYKIDRRTLYWTALHLVVYVLLGVALFFLYEGGYLSAWFTSFVVAIIALMALSIPRKIVVTDEELQVVCLLDITEIPLAEIASIHTVGRKKKRWMFPLFGAWGFFGYYGHYFDLRHFDRAKVYASQWRNLVEITDIYEERIYLSAEDPDAFVAEISQRIDARKNGEENSEID